jgi:hypothetical protein
VIIFSAGDIPLTRHRSGHIINDLPSLPFRSPRR